VVAGEGGELEPAGLVDVDEAEPPERDKQELDKAFALVVVELSRGAVCDPRNEGDGITDVMAPVVLHSTATNLAENVVCASP
jgi:hypothetical protein